MASACINNTMTNTANITLFDASSRLDWFNPRENPPANLHSGDFEFRLDEDPSAMLPADQLFSEGKLLPQPLQIAAAAAPPSDQIRSLDLAEALVSKAPNCKSKWKTLLKKSQSPSSFKTILQRNHKPSQPTTSLSQPLLEPCNASDPPIEPPKLRLVKSVPRAPPDSSNGERVIPMDSPRMNSSGKVVFKHLERSCSSPSSFNGGGRGRIMERSHSANVVRVAPVLNVALSSSLRGSSSSKPGSSVFGFSKLFSSNNGSSSKREEAGLAKKKPN